MDSAQHLRRVSQMLYDLVKRYHVEGAGLVVLRIE